MKRILVLASVLALGSLGTAAYAQGTATGPSSGAHHSATTHKGKKTSRKHKQHMGANSGSASTTTNPAPK